MDRVHSDQPPLTPRSWSGDRPSPSCSRPFWRWLGWGLLPLFGPLLGAGSLLGLQAAVSPPPAIAYTTRINVFLDRDQEESFESLLRRAEIVARAGVQRSFDADVLASEAIITVVAENQGITVPLLTVEVTRAQWSTRPDVEYWARYYETAKALLTL